MCAEKRLSLRNLAITAVNRHEWSEAASYWEALADKNPAKRQKALKWSKRSRDMAEWKGRAEEERKAIGPQFVRDLAGGEDWNLIGSRDVSGGRNCVSLRRLEFQSRGGSSRSLLERVPAPLNRRIELNERENYFYDTIIGNSDYEFLPKFYGRYSSGVLHFQYFEYIFGRKGTHSDWRAVFRCLCDMGNVRPDADTILKAGHKTHAARTLDVAQIRQRLDTFTPGRDIAVNAFSNVLETIEDQYSSFDFVLGHGDLHIGNVIVSERRAVLVDWTRWGLVPPGADLGQYLLSRRELDLKEFEQKWAVPYAQSIGRNKNEILFAAQYACIIHQLMTRTPTSAVPGLALQMERLVSEVS